MKRALLLTVTLLLAAACQQAPTYEAPPTPSGAVSPAGRLRGEGDALMARGDHAGALEKYRQAIDLEPSSVPLRFALGTAYSFLDKRREAVAQFRWVVANGAARSVEHREARRWLVRVGAWVEPAGGGDRAELASSEASAKESSEDSSKKADPSATGRISMKTEWPGLRSEQQPVRLDILLVGDDDATRDVKRRTLSALGDAYEFVDVPEGRYRIVAVYLEDTTVWDQPVTVRADKQTDLVLARADSRIAAYEFPEARRPRK